MKRRLVLKCSVKSLERNTNYSVPVRRLRHRDTRDLAMRGNDGLGFRIAQKRVKVLKVEAKSRLALTTRDITEAREGLEQHRGRPNPETLAYLQCHLLLNDRDDEAVPITFLLNNPIYVTDVCHLLFTLSGNAPKKFLEANSGLVHKGIKLRLCGLRAKEHKAFVKDLFGTRNSLTSPRVPGSVPATIERVSKRPR